MIEIGATLASIIAGSLVTLLKITALIISYRIISLGYDLLIKGIKGNFTFAWQLNGFGADLRSASPGLLFLLLGCSLAGWAISIKYVQHVEKTTLNSDKNIPSIEMPVAKEIDLSKLVEGK